MPSLGEFSRSFCISILKTGEEKRSQHRSPLVTFQLMVANSGNQETSSHLVAGGGRESRTTMGGPRLSEAHEGFKLSGTHYFLRKAF